MRVVLPALLFIVISCARPDGAGGERLVVRPDGIGAVRVGMSLHEAGAALGEPLKASYADFEGCDYVDPTRLPPGIAFMVLDDTIARVDVDSVGVVTAEGAGVGDTETRVLELYGDRVRVEPHHYMGPEGHYLVVTSKDDSLAAIIFETDGKVVTMFRAGRRPAVEYVEGCA